MTCGSLESSARRGACYAAQSKHRGTDMPVSRIARFLVGALLVCGSVLAAEPAKPVVVTNTPTNPVPTTAQGTTQVSGSVGLTNTAANPAPTTAQRTTPTTRAL